MSLMMVLVVTSGSWLLLSVAVALSLARTMAIGDTVDRHLASESVAAEYRLVG